MHVFIVCHKDYTKIENRETFCNILKGQLNSKSLLCFLPINLLGKSRITDLIVLKKAFVVFLSWVHRNVFPRTVNSEQWTQLSYGSIILCHSPLFLVSLFPTTILLEKYTSIIFALVLLFLILLTSTKDRSIRFVLGDFFNLFALVWPNEAHVLISWFPSVFFLYFGSSKIDSLVNRKFITWKFLWYNGKSYK